MILQFYEIQVKSANKSVISHIPECRKLFMFSLHVIVLLFIFQVQGEPMLQIQGWAEKFGDPTFAPATIAPAMISLTTKS